MPSIYVKLMAREWLFDEKLNAYGLEHKGAWGNLLALAKICGENGKFIDLMGNPYTSDYIIKNARITAIHFNNFIVAQMLVKSSNGNGIEYSIKNWLKYQPEYDRTKPYRNSIGQLSKERESSKEKENKDKPKHTDIDRDVDVKDATPKSKIGPFKPFPEKSSNSGVEMLHPNKSKFSKAKVIKLENASKKPMETPSKPSAADLGF